MCFITKEIKKLSKIVFVVKALAMFKLNVRLSFIFLAKVPYRKSTMAFLVNFLVYVPKVLRVIVRLL
jgi:hypothetical protein